MKIIAIEGIDKSGKHSAALVLTKALKQKGLKVVNSEFHNYSTPTGKLIQQWLYKEYDVDQLTIELIMAADKQAQQKWFQELEREGTDVLILDRYILSQWVYSQANGVEPEFSRNLQKYMRKPDYTILIDIPAEISIQRQGKYGENDRYESDYQLLHTIRTEYLKYGGQQNNFIVDGTLPLDEVHQTIIEHLLLELL